MLVVLTSVVASAIIADYINWDSLNRDFIHTSELGRGYLASFILVLDFSIVMQVRGISSIFCCLRLVICIFVVYYLFVNFIFHSSGISKRSHLYLNF